MKYPDPVIAPLDQSRIGRDPLYVFPLPHGPHAFVTCEGDSVIIALANPSGPDEEDLEDCFPELSKAFHELYIRMLSEPNPKYTLNGETVNFPEIDFEVILFDSPSEPKKDGSATWVRESLENWTELGVPCPGLVSAMVLGVTVYGPDRKKEDAQIWSRRAWVMRHTTERNSGIIYPLILAPLGFRPGIATDRKEINWAMISMCFKSSFRGALIVDVMNIPEDTVLAESFAVFQEDIEV